MQLKQNCRYALVCPTSMGVRITPLDRQPVQTSRSYIMQATSAESNVLNVPACLGLPTKVLTAFVAGSPIAAFIKSELRSRGIEFEGPEIPQGDAWGYRHQFNIADSGYGVRGARVWNDRSGEVGRILSAQDFDLKRLFEEEGVQILHLSGLIAALSPQTSATCLALAEAAHKAGTLISFDLNYRASFWQGREQELRDAFTRIASQADFLIGNEEDFQLALGVHGPEAGGAELNAKLSGFQGMIQQARQQFPHVSVFATTLREVVSANENLWGALLLADDVWYVERPRSIAVLDRIGGGDGFVSGLLYGVLKGWAPEKWLQFGWASGSLAVTMLNDYASPVDEEQLWNIYAGNARVKR
jgi:2-dehydro-3-deoxygluconokinase